MINEDPSGLVTILFDIPAQNLSLSGMYLGFYNFYRQYNGNKMFTDPASPIGDNLMYPFVCLGEKLRSTGHQAVTLDTDDLSKKLEFTRYIRYL